MSGLKDRIRPAKVAYMEEADDSGNVIEGTPVYAASAAPSPTKERPNTGRSRKERSRRSGSTSPIMNGYPDSDSTAHPVSRRDSYARVKDKEKPSSSSGNRKSFVTRPPTRQVKTTPILQTASSHSRRAHEDAQYYGISPTTITSASSRPRSHTAQQRPASYYGQQPVYLRQPPLSNPRYYPVQSPHTQGMIPGSYPQPQWGPPGSYPMAPSPLVRQQPPAQGPDYFSGTRALMDRFSRPQSAMSNRGQPSVGGYADEYDEEPRKALRRVSLTKKVRDADDRRKMPPPPPPQRTMSARPLSSRGSFAPPPTPYQKGIGYDDEAFESDDNSLYQEVSQRVVPYEYGTSPLSVSRTRRPSVGASTLVYDLGPYRTEVANSRSNRRNSYYGGQTSVSSGSGFEDKMREAAAYQDDVTGGIPMPLTAETLRKANKHGGANSRSTKSSGSHDESDYRQSATTRTTRSSNNNNDEEVTILLKGGGAVLTAGNAQMHCDDGAEITITSRPSGNTLRGGSDQASTIYTEDRRSRMLDRLPIRARANSQAFVSRSAVPRYNHGWDNAPFAPPPQQLPGPEWH